MNASGARPCRDVCGAYLIRPYTDAAKPAGNCTKNRFEAQNPPGIAPKTDLKPETRRGLRQKPIWSPKPAGNCTKNRFEAQNPPRIGPKTDLKPQTHRGLGQKQVFGARRPLISHPQQLTRNNEQLTRNNEQWTPNNQTTNN